MELILSSSWTLNMYKDLHIWLTTMQQKAINFKHMYIPKQNHKASHHSIKCIVDI